jgi:hypothetical protein
MKNAELGHDFESVHNVANCNIDFFSQELAQQLCVCGIFLIFRKNKKNGKKCRQKQSDVFRLVMNLFGDYAVQRDLNDTKQRISLPNIAYS